MPGVDVDAAPEELTGERVLVRRPRPEDAQALWEAVDGSRAHIGRWMPWPRGYASVQDAVAYIARVQAAWDPRGERQMLIFGRQDQRLLGGIGLSLLPRSVRAFEVGYWLRQDAEGHGYMRESVQLVTRLAFGPLQASRVAIRVQPANVRSRRVAEALGFVVEGLARKAGLGADGEPVDLVMHALTRDDLPSLPWAHDLRA
jgi:RimJ/RimL family protein N-acetyltransferase